MVRASQPRRSTWLAWLLAALVIGSVVVRLWLATGVMRQTARERRPVRLFVIISSRLQNVEERQALRETWLRDLLAEPGGEAEYRFFTDTPSDIVDLSEAIQQQIDTEVQSNGDLVFQPVQPGRQCYGARGLHALQWVLARFEPAYILRIDDDSFACWRRLWTDLQSAPRERFFWGKYWLHGGFAEDGGVRADESFMLWSGDVARVVAQLMRVEERLTLALNFQALANALNLTVFDDRDRIDSQQEPLTDCMHREPPSPSSSHNPCLATFCERAVFAHHVPWRTIVAAYAANTGASRLRHSSTSDAHPRPQFVGNSPVDRQRLPPDQLVFDLNKFLRMPKFRQDAEDTTVVQVAPARRRHPSSCWTDPM